MKVGYHKTYQSKTIQGFQRPSTSTHKTVIPPQGQTSQNHHHIGLRPSFPGLPKCLLQPRLPGLVTQPTVVVGLPEHCSNQGFQD